MNKLNKKIILSLITGLFILIPLFNINAQTITIGETEEKGLGKSQKLLKDYYHDDEYFGQYYDNPRLGFDAVIGNIIKAFLGFLGVIFLIIVLYSGFNYLTAGGNEDRITQSRKWLINGIIGVVIISAAYVAAAVILQALEEATDDAVIDPYAEVQDFNYYGEF